MFLFTLLACNPSSPSAPVAAMPEAVEAAPVTAAKTTTSAGWDHYGQPFTVTAASDCKDLIASPSTSVDTTVRVTGRIENVCQKAGCWMVIADDDGKYLRVTMKNHKFGVPTSTTTGPETRVDVEGTLVEKPLDAATLAHLKSEAKGDEATKAAQFAPKYEIVATGVAVQKNG